MVALPNVRISTTGTAGRRIHHRLQDLFQRLVLVAKTEETGWMGSPAG